MAVDSFVFDRGSHLEGGVASLQVVEDLEVFEYSVGQLDPGGPSPAVQEFYLHPKPRTTPSTRYQNSPRRTPIEGTSPDCCARSVNAQEV